MYTQEKSAEISYLYLEYQHQEQGREEVVLRMEALVRGEVRLMGLVEGHPLELQLEVCLDLVESFLLLHLFTKSNI